MSFWNGREWVREAPPAAGVVKPEGRVKHVAKAVLEASLITALTFGLIAGSAFAGKGSRGGSGATGGGTISLAPLVVDADGDGAPSFGDTVTFNLSTSASQPYVNLLCSQGGVQVYNSWRGYFAGSLDSNWNFVLGSGGWTSGAADCTAWLGVYTKRGFQRMNSTSFYVGA
jgi:hypothetical protein